MAETERHRSMDDLWEKMGEVRAGQVALNQRLDGLALERQQQHGEAIRSLADTQAQQHEIKHELVQVSTKFAVINDRVVTLCKQLRDNRDAAEARETVVMARLDGLFAWRNWMRGVWATLSAIVGGLLVLFGHDVMEFGKGLFHWGGK